MLKEKWAAVKKHLSEHCETYITAGTTIVIMTTTTIVATKLRERKENATLEISAPNSTNLVNPFVNKLNIYNLGPGRPGKHVLHIESGNIYRSQRDAAQALGLDERTLSRHLNGLQEHASQQHFKTVQIETPFNSQWRDYNGMLDKAVAEANRFGRLPF